MKRHISIAGITALLLALLVSQIAFAAPSTPTADQIDAVAKELWCPLCNGVRLDNCELTACSQMREVIGQHLTDGESKEQIKGYFVQQYGEVVLGMPAPTGSGLLVWAIPFLLAIVAVGWLAYFVRAWQRKKPRALPAPSDNSVKTAYDARIDDELKRYE
jgi:cytochrome c-type biogenesis protein CcmH